MTSSQTYTTCTLEGSSLARGFEPKSHKKNSAHVKQQCACTHNSPQYSSFKPPNHIMQIFQLQTMSYRDVEWHNA